MVHLGNAINDGPRQGWHTIGQNSCIAPLQQYSESTPEVGDCFSFLLPSMPRQGCPQLFWSVYIRGDDHGLNVILHLVVGRSNVLSAW